MSMTDICIAAIIYLVVTVAEFAFYGVTGGKLLKRLQHSKHMGRAVNLKKVRKPRMRTLSIQKLTALSSRVPLESWLAWALPYSS